MKEIPLTLGYFAIVDDEDFDWLNQWGWYVNKHRNGVFYAHRQYRNPAIKNKKGHAKQVYIAMHRIIMSVTKKVDIDHINHNGLDNRKANLRICTHSQNLQNQRRLKKNKSFSKYKGVRRTGQGKWKVEICYENTHIYLGCFACEVAAAKTYDKVASIIFGEFAHLNFPKNKLKKA